MCCMLLLTSLTVTAVGAQDEPEVEVSDMDEDLGLDEEELRVLMAEGEGKTDEATVMDKDVSDADTAHSKEGADANVSFQVRNWP